VSSRKDRFVALVIACLSIAAPALAAGDAFDARFTGATLRLDLYHTGSASEESFTADRLRVEGPWPGSRTQLLDRTNLGLYFVEVVDRETQEALYSRGFASIFGEWQTTGEAKRISRTFPEAVRFPEPRRPFQVRLRKRGPDRSFREIWSADFDPAARGVDRSPVAPQRVWTLFENGDPAVKVDLLMLGDGYTEEQLPKFHADAERLAGQLFRWAPFATHKQEFNVRAIDTPAALAGISRPRAGVFRDSPLGASYNSFDSERYVLTSNDRAWRDVAAAAPYDFVMIVVNERKYGGGGIYQLYSTVAADSGFADYIGVHEFGHHFAALADEYYTSPVAYEETAAKQEEPWEPNVTADPTAAKWKELLTPGLPLPSSWQKERFEQAERAIQQERQRLRDAGAPEGELEALFRREREQVTALLASDGHAGQVGAFEGADYAAKGLYRPSTDCIMFTRDEVGFCLVCQRAIERVIDLYTH
jgi:IgA Peptidase M64/Peptidase M64 N-terminus